MTTHPDPTVVQAEAPQPRHPPTVLRLIAVAKLGKALLFLGAGIAIAFLAKHDVQATLEGWLAWIHFDPNGHLFRKAIATVSNADPHQLRLIGIASFCYATLYLVEGIGLWFDRAWAEWLTLVGSSLLIPVEIFEICHHPGPTPVVVLLLNLAVVAYLAKRLRDRRRATSTGAAAGSTPAGS
ncbi:MAG: DUF2127 domain-containing protein [Planctomycetes bacterium]|nr:DUF2127 domain-containing protein [Planctomycetota bacterium]